MASGRKSHGNNLLAGLVNLTENTEEKSSDIKVTTPKQAVPTPEPIKEPQIPEPAKAIEKVIETAKVIEEVKKKPGRPRKFENTDETVVLGIRVLKEEAKFLEKFGGEYGGKTGYVTHLIRQEMKRINDN